ncbi:exo-beta-N-acetylmuramidase NamZ domain-containing protein [Thermodesulfobacteriota bacterium]
MTVLTGLDEFKSEYYKILKGQRLGLLSNQASVSKDLTHARETLYSLFPDNLKALYGPQHGYAGEDQDNMIETGHSYDKELKIPVFSLYSESREPTSEMLDLIDVLVIDMQDVGTRVYTFTSTMLNCLKAAKKYSKRVVIMDRPNPLGGDVIEGNLLSPELFSFVGPFSMPMRHGMTMGELALLFNREFSIGCDLEIIKMKGWDRTMLWEDTALIWAVPSPNMPLPETAYVYPGQVIWEGTNISEGRGTCRPFEIFGAPFLDTHLIKRKVPPHFLKGCTLREISFKPTFNKWHDQICKGFMIHILDRKIFRSYETAIALLRTIVEIHQDEFTWKDPPYEYVYDKLPIDLIIGNTGLRKAIEKGEHINRIKDIWLLERKDFIELREQYLLYK